VALDDGLEELDCLLTDARRHVDDVEKRFEGEDNTLGEDAMEGCLDGLVDVFLGVDIKGVSDIEEELEKDQGDLRVLLHTVDHQENAWLDVHDVFFLGKEKPVKEECELGVRSDRIGLDTSHQPADHDPPRDDRGTECDIGGMDSAADETDNVRNDAFVLTIRKVFGHDPILISLLVSDLDVAQNKVHLGFEVWCDTDQKVLVWRRFGVQIAHALGVVC
jgi:hypothetical protein